MPAETPASYRDSPPLAHTGGFGEPTCGACHAESPVNSGEGVLEIGGFPGRYEADSSYQIVVSMVQPDMVMAGFELAIRDAQGKKFGDLAATSSGVLVSTSDAGVQYAHHSLQGTTLTYPDTARWSLMWTAPLDPAGPAVLNVAVNAANGDNSEFGDAVYSAERTAGLVVQPE